MKKKNDLIKQIENCKNNISKERDNLCDLLEEANDLIRCTEEVEPLLDEAIAILSERL